MSAGDDPKKRNGVDRIMPDLMEVNPVQKRPPLKPAVIPASDTQTVATRKVVDSQLQQVARINSMDHDLVALGEGTVLGFVRTDMRLELLDRKFDEEFASLRRDLGVGMRERQQSESELADRVDDLENEITSPGFDRRTGRVVTRHELEARDLKVKLEAQVAENAKLEAARKEAADDAKEAKRARRNFFYGIIASLIVTAITGGVAYAIGHAHGTASAHTVEVEQPEAPAPAKAK